MSQTLLGLFLVGAVNRAKKEEKDKSGKSKDSPWTNWESPKKNKKEGQVQIGKPPRLKSPRLPAPEKESK